MLFTSIHNPYRQFTGYFIQKERKRCGLMHKVFTVFMGQKYEYSIRISAEVPNFQSRQHKKDGDKIGKQGRVESISKSNNSENPNRKL